MALSGYSTLQRMGQVSEKFRRKAPLHVALGGVRMRSISCIHPVMPNSQIFGCFPGKRGFSVAQANRFDSQMGRSLIRGYYRAATEGRFLFSVASSGANWFTTI